MSFAIALACQCPCLFGDTLSGNIIELNRLHHLTNQTICENDNRCAVHISDVKRIHNHVNCFLNGCGSQNYIMVVTIGAAFYSHVIVSLTRLDCAKARAAAHHVDDNCGQTSVGDIADTFLFQSNTRGGGTCQYARTGCRRTINHIDSGYFRLSLNKCAAYFR